MSFALSALSQYGQAFFMKLSVFVFCVDERCRVKKILWGSQLLERPLFLNQSFMRSVSSNSFNSSVDIPIDTFFVVSMKCSRGSWLVLWKWMSSFLSLRIMTASSPASTWQASRSSLGSTSRPCLPILTLKIDATFHHLCHNTSSMPLIRVPPPLIRIKSSAEPQILKRLGIAYSIKRLR